MKESRKEVVVKKIRTQLLGDLNRECTCVETLDNVVHQEKMECKSSIVIYYSGRFLHWSSSAFTVHHLAQFLESWRPMIIVEASAVGFGLVPNYTFTFNVTKSQSITVMEEVGSGEILVDDLDNLGSGEGVTEEMTKGNDKKDENDKNIVEVAGIGSNISAGLRVHAVGSVIVTTLFAGIVTLTSFSCSV